MSATGSPGRRRVRVWFGEHVIADYRADAAQAGRYAEAMQRRFAGLRVTTDDLPDDPGSWVPQLPTEPLWPLTAK
jgi:hypothetical protein